MNTINSKEHGICYCNGECTCTNITFMIFQSGNTIGTGFKSIEQINFVYKQFNLLINQMKDSVIKQDFFL